MQIALGFSGLILTLAGFLAVIVSNINESISSNGVYTLAWGITAIGITYFGAAIFKYRGGWRFVLGVLLLAIPFAIAGFGYDYHQVHKSDVSLLLLGLPFTLLIPAILLFRFGHKRHRDNFLGIEKQNGFNSVDNLPQKPQSTLSTPLPTWLVCLLAFFSFTLYSVVLAYRIAKDLVKLGNNKMNPIGYATAVFFPAISVIVFYSLAKNIAETANKQNISFRVTPFWLCFFLILISAATYKLPGFLFPLSFLLISVPWLLLNQQMNALRLSYKEKQAVSQKRFTKTEYGILLFGIPLMAAALYGNQNGYAYYMGEKLAPHQYVQGNTPIYRLQIESDNWRKVPLGTLDTDTDLELIAKSLDRWIVVRVSPNHQISLDSMVTSRREIVSSSWQDYRYSESRSLDSGAKLTPLSLAAYTHGDGLIDSSETIYVATVTTPTTVIETVGYSPTHRNNEQGLAIKAIVNSLRLVNKD